MFADVSGSTNLFEVVGDRKAREAIAATLQALAAIVRSYDGKVVKTIGDEVMCVFSTANRAAMAACKMQERMEGDNPAKGVLGDRVTLSIRVGFHFGPTLVERGDVFGDSVNVAARMVAQAKGGQIITTDETIQLLNEDLQDNSRFVDNAPIKGKKGVIKIHELIWQAEEDVTSIAPVSTRTAAMAPNSVALNVCYRDTQLKMTQTRPKLVMGRSPGCDLPVAEKLASREHALIELRRERFYIIDQSTNGTFVHVKDTGETFLRREEMPITASGSISLGRSFKDHPTEVVTFTPL